MDKEEINTQIKELSEREWLKLLSSTCTKSTDSEIVIGLDDADDAACVAWTSPLGENEELLAVSTDSICENIHFSAEAPASWLAQRIVYAGISDLYAIGAKPRYILLNIVDKSLNNQYYREFLENIYYINNKEQITLIGGNTTRGSKRQIHISALGSVPRNQSRPRSGAKPGDLIALTSMTGLYANARRNCLWDRMVLPQLSPWLKVVREIASSCIDVSDGLLGDLEQICQASGVGARLWLEKLAEPHRCPPSCQLPDLEEILFGGEDYVLCFSFNENFINNNELMKLSPMIVGRIIPGQGVCVYQDQTEAEEIMLPSRSGGFDHFDSGMGK